ADTDGTSTVECIADATETFTLPTVTDACGNTLTPSAAVITENPNPLTCEGTRTYTYTYTDCTGNSDSWAYTYTIDLLPFTLPVAGTQIVDNLADAIEPTPPAVNDNCGNTIVPTGPTVSSNPACQGTVVYTFNYEDCAGNNADWTYTYTLQLAPFTTPDDETSTVNCIADAVAPTPPVVTDSNGTNLVPSAPTITETPNPLTCEGTRAYTYTYTDCAGNSDDWTYTYTIDTPTFTIADADGASAVECIADATETFTLPTVTDACGNTLTPAAAVITENPNPLTCEGTRTYTYTYTDCAGNSDSWAYTYTIDTPAFTIADTDGTSTVECIADATETFTLPTVTDACGNTLTPSAAVITETSDPLTCERTRTYSYTYTDCAGNSDSWAYTYTIKDTTPPELTLPSNATAECSDDLTPIEFGVATATDNCDTNPQVTFNDVRTDGQCSGTFTIIRTWTATDACGNSVSADQTISTSDTTAPTFDQTTLPGNMTVECGNVPEQETLTASDNCGIAIVTVEDVRTDGNCDFNYVITRTYTATDDCGLTTTHIQVITVQDSTPPSFVEPLPEANITVECDAIPVAETLTATDSCGNATVTINDSRTNGECVSSYFITRTWTAVDDCNNATTFTQLITVQDTTPPEFVEELPMDITVECDAVPTAANMTAIDNCGNAIVTVEDIITQGDCPSNYNIARKWVATDECGLTTSHTQNIKVQDTAAPVPTSTFDSMVNASCTDIPEIPQLDFADNCSTNVIEEYNEDNSFDPDVLQDYQIIRTWTVKDACNNEAVYTQTINVTLDEIFSEVIAEDRCFEEGVVNLNNYLPNSLNTDGTWEMVEGNPDAPLNGSIFDPTELSLSEDFLPGDGGIDYKFRYTTTDMGCISVTEVIMNIHADCIVLPCGENDIVISKAITPNGDGYNDTFDIAGIDLCGFVAEVKVFNRWGALVYESNNYTLGSIETSGAKGDWDGSAPNSSIGTAGKLPNGTYYFIINLKNSGLSPLTGPVYLGTK
ncbi:gliding motility-associated C-terminal domain-containing protein, partial [Cognatitamlana onchidii]|uniref:gliding motility-associated C-terminal domain-containing protein n=1 Tax=Cognatitamlana onchidii TaxID=2562860 RepID=UPI00196B5A31